MSSSAPEGLVGRAAEVASLARAMERASAGSGRLVLLTGDAGIGKTRLAEDAGARARTQGSTVLWASCWEGGGAPAFWPWIQVLRGAADAGVLADQTLLASLEDPGPPPAGGVQDPERARFGLYDRLAGAVRAAAATGPVLVVIDDLHWADPASFAAVRFVANGIKGVQVLILATCRESEVTEDPALAPIFADLTRTAEIHALTGLASDEVARLIAVATGSEPTAALAGSVHDRTLGNPLFVKEVARLLAAQGRLDTASTVPVPPTVRDVLHRRFARLSQACFELLSVASVLGQRFELDAVAGVAGVDREAALGLLGEAERAGLIELGDGSAAWFVHGLMRDALYEGLGPVRRSHLHAAAGGFYEKRVEQTPELLGAVAVHHVRAAPVGDIGKAIEFSMRAGRRSAAMLAYEDAVGHFERAISMLDLAAAPDDLRGSVLLEAGDARLRCGDLPEARRIFGDAAAIARRSGSAEALARAALGFGAGLGGFEVDVIDRSQVDLLEEALAALPDRDEELRAWVMARLSVALSLSGDETRRLALIREAVEMARRIDASAATAYALSAYCDAIAGPAHVDERFAAAGEMLDLSRALPTKVAQLEMELLARRFRVMALMERGDVVAADAEIDAFARASDELGQPLYAWYVPLWRGMRAQMQGRADDAGRFCAEAEAIGARAHSMNARLLTMTLRFAFSYQAGRRDEAYARMSAALVETGLTFDVVAGGALMRAYQEAAAHGPAARDGLRRAMDAVLDQLQRDAEWTPMMAFGIDASCWAEDPGSAARFAALLEPFASLHVIDGIGAAWLGPVDLALGKAAALCGRTDAAAEHFARALAEIERVGGVVLAEQVRSALAGAGIHPPQAVEGRGGTFRRDGDGWAVAFGGAPVHVRDSKGMRDIARLLARPGAEMHVMELASPPTAERLDRGGALGDALDDRARGELARRVEDLREEIDEAESLGDDARAERARGELDAVAAHLRSALGIGGRSRTMGDPAERARKAVAARIKDAIGRIGREDQVLARHLERSIQTGTFCVYDPAEPVDWAL